MKEKEATPRKKLPSFASKSSIISFIIGVCVGVIVFAFQSGRGFEIGIAGSKFTVAGEDPYLECLHNIMMEARKNNIEVSLTGAREACLPLEQEFGSTKVDNESRKQK